MSTELLELYNPIKKNNITLNKRFIISYEQGYTNWYVSEFYKYFHKKLLDNINLDIEYISINELSKRFNRIYDNSNPNIFNWYNLILYDKIEEKLFIHSWHDYGHVIASQIVSDSLNVVGFSSSSNITQDLIENNKNKLQIFPSIYFLENWSNVDLISKYYNTFPKLNKAYFNGYMYGIRENFHAHLKNSINLIIKDKRKDNNFLNQEEYYRTISQYSFGLSFNGAANICYRDLEIFGLGLVNLREPLNTKTKNPILKNEHYIEFFDDKIINNLLSGNNIKDEIENCFEQLLDENNEKFLNQISENGRNWFLSNCLPDKQYEILIEIINETNFFN